MAPRSTDDRRLDVIIDRAKITSRLRPLFRPLKNQLTFRGMAIAKFCRRAKGPLRIWALLAAKRGDETVHAAL